MDKRQGGFPDKPKTEGQPLCVAQFYGDDDYEDFEERAAIMEYDGGLSREEAEEKAALCAEAGKGYKSVAFVSERIHTATDCEIGEDSVELRAKCREW